MDRSERTISLPPKFSVPTAEVWLQHLYLNLYDRGANSILRRYDHFSAFGVYLDLCGIEWVEHNHSPGVFYPAMEGGGYGYDAWIPANILGPFGKPGRAYGENYRFFCGISRMTFPQQAKQIEGLLRNVE